MSSFVLDFQDIDKTKLMVVGGKGANLGELSRIEGIRVPDGFCLSTEAFQRIIGETSSMNELLDQLSLLKVEDRDKIGELSGEIRRVIEGIAIPQDIHEETTRLLSRLDGKNAYAVRSSATAEDLPTASFAGPQDTYLNIIGKEAILKHISKCWASLFTDRAVIYRMQNGFDHKKVHLSVVIQKMVYPEAAGIMFTAGGRLFVDVTQDLASPARRAIVVDVLGKDPLIKDALMTILGRGDFIKSLPDDKQEQIPGKSNQDSSLADYKTLNEIRIGSD
jgi:pyruvate,water dikinase